MGNSVARLLRWMGEIGRVPRPLSPKHERSKLRAELMETNIASARAEKRMERRIGHVERRLGLSLRRIEFNSAFRDLGYSPPPCPHINKSEFSVFSQNGEDGILLSIFDVVGLKHRTVIEISPGNGIECNSANLIVNFMCSGLLVDGDEKNIGKARAFYDATLGPRAQDVKTRAAFVTVENVDTLITEAGLSGEVDLLSVDIDGNDFWIWKAITAVSPRVVVCEFNRGLGKRSITIPYDPQFRRGANGPKAYYGASLPALARLGGALGYSLVGRDSSGVNAFFVRNDLLRDPLAAQDPEALLDQPVTYGYKQTKAATVQNLPWIEIGVDGELKSNV